MEPFEDENPFDTDAERIHSETSSTSKVDISAPASPPPRPPSLDRPAFPSSGSHRLPPVNKTDFCCVRDRWLHSGEDVEILVRVHSAIKAGCSLASLTSVVFLVVSSVDVLRFVVLALVGCGGCSDHGRAEDIAELDVALHHICDPIRGRFSLYIVCVPGRLIKD